MRKGLAFILVVCFAFLLVACKPEPESKVGTVGPAGGIIFYDKGEYSNGWRYLEAAPADLRVVAGIPTVNSSAPGYAEAEPGYVFGFYRASAHSSNLFVDGTTTGEECSTDTRIEFGWSNTRMLVNKMADETYSEPYGSSKTGNYAARLCEVLSYTVNGTTYDDWFLPSKDELDLMYTQLQAKGLGNFSYDSYWSSCESSEEYAWCQSFVAPSSGQLGTLERKESIGVRPIRMF